MALTTDDLNAVRAQWEEWTADSGFHLHIEVVAEAVTATMAPFGPLAARVQAEPSYVQVAILKLEPMWGPGLGRIVFSQRVPYDAAALRASVSVLARTIAGHQERLADREGGDAEAG